MAAPFIEAALSRLRSASGLRGLRPQSAALGWLGDFLLMPQPPLLGKEGKTLRLNRSSRWATRPLRPGLMSNAAPRLHRSSFADNTKRILNTSAANLSFANPGR